VERLPLPLVVVKLAHLPAKKLELMKPVRMHQHVEVVPPSHLLYEFVHRFRFRVPAQD
jgi:hypothetical protein